MEFWTFLSKLTLEIALDIVCYPVNDGYNSKFYFPN